MKVVICPNSHCKTPIKVFESREIGGVNDKGVILIECSICNTKIPCRVVNPDNSSVSGNGRIIDSWDTEMSSENLSKYGMLPTILDDIQVTYIYGYEEPPKVIWNPSSKPLFEISGVNHEAIATEFLMKHGSIVADKYSAFKNHYLKNGFEKKSFLVINYEYGGTKYKAVFAKEIESERDLVPENLYLIHHSHVSLEEQIDGIYKRDEIKIFLERFLNRWKYVANEVLLVVPFIGFNYRNSEDALYQLWNWLDMNIDASKTRLITRKGTFNLFKEAQDNQGIEFDVLVRHGLIEPLIEKMNSKEMTFFQKSHAKYYAGIFDGHVEVLSGSFNIHEGQYFDNVIFKKYNKDFFKARYLHMFDTFEFAVPDDELVHYFTIGNENDKNISMSLKEFTQLELNIFD